MAASAKEKAYNLKDSYVAGLIEGGATAPAPAMPTQDMGEQASVMMDVKNGTEYYTNDGDRNVYIRTDGGIHRTVPQLRGMIEKSMVSTGNAGTPMNHRRSGYTGSQPMSFGRQKLFQDMSNDPNAVN